MATTPPLRLNRNQLAQFLRSQEQIRAFESLFTLTEQLAPTTLNDIAQDAGSALSAAAAAQNQIHDAEQALSVMLAACEAKATQALQQIQALEHVAQLVETMPPPRERKRTRYGQFWDTTSQVAPLVNTAYPVTFNTSDTLNSGVRLRSPSASEVEVDTEGLYNFQVSVQLDTTSGGTDLVWLWMRKNGADIAASACQVQIQGNNAELLQAFNLFIDLKAGDYVQVMWATDDTAARLASFASAAFRPAVPSVILTVSNIRGDL